MGYIEGENRKQKLLFPESLDEYVTEESPVRLFDAFADSLDITALEFDRSTPKEEGRPGYNPRDLIKLYIYGYYYHIRSSRQLERACKVNLEVMWLIRKLTPDFRTIANFRRDNKTAIRKVFKEFNRFCYKMNLFSLEGISIDGSKFKAVNAKDNNFTQSKLDDRIERLDEHIKEYLSALDAADLSDEEANELEKKLKEYKERKKKYEAIQKKMNDENLRQLSLTDPESKLMKMNEGFGVGYNTQTAVDVGTHLIAGFEVTDCPTDHGQITNIAQKVKEDFEEFESSSGGSEEKNIHDIIETIADKGYQDSEDMASSLAKGIIPNVIPQNGNVAEVEYDYEPCEITEKIRNSKKTEDLEKCLKAGVVPVVYKEILKFEEMKEKTLYEYESTDAGTAKMTTEQMILKAREGYFVRDAESNLVFCPQGKILRQKSVKKNGNIRYCNKLACKNCKHKCTKSEWKEVDFSKDSLIHKVSGNKKDSVKDDSVKRIKRIKQKAVFTLKLNMEKLKKRMCVSEHPFGTIKRHLGGYYFLLKGKIKVEAETALLFMAYNMRRAINMVGVNRMVAALA